jgi:hypothetical protein
MQRRATLREKRSPNPHSDPSTTLINPSFLPPLRVSTVVGATTKSSAEDLCGGAGGGAGVGLSTRSSPTHSVRMIFPTQSHSVSSHVKYLEI